MTDVSYEVERNSFLKAAEKVANDKHGKVHETGDRDSWIKRWNYAFLNEMDRLVKVNSEE